jgi:hypothetical protein
MFVSIAAPSTARRPFTSRGRLPHPALESLGRHEHARRDDPDLDQIVWYCARDRAGPRARASAGHPNPVAEIAWPATIAARLTNAEADKRSWDCAGFARAFI